MRSVRTLVLLLAVPLALPAPADEVVLKDGRSIVTKGPYKVKGRNALMTAADGTLVSIPVSEIDLEKTAEAQARASEPAPPGPSPTPKPLTPAEAARVKSSRKASVVLNDADVTHPLDTSEGADGAPKSATDGKVELSGQTITPKPDGYTVAGSLINTGETDVLALVLTVEAVGDKNTTIVSGFASIAKDTLAPGEKTTFTTELKTDAKVSVFRYYPRWKVEVKAGSPEAAAAAAENPAGTPEETPTPAPTPPPPAPTAKPTARPASPGYAAPAASGPVGAPEKPGGTYLPVPADNQPKQPQ